MELDYKKMHRNILKLTHPDNCEKYTASLPGGVKRYLDMMRNEANNAYEEGDYKRLNEIYIELIGESEPQRNNSSFFEYSYHDDSSYNNSDDYEDGDLISFFNNNGLEVLDKREKGGALWVIGTEEDIGDIVRMAENIYGIKGTYSSGGKTTKGRAAWWTK